jgi:hypothetical protein
MNARICKCCGESMPETGNVLSRNPNLCASCSSLEDGAAENRKLRTSSPTETQEPANKSVPSLVTLYTAACSE